VVPSQRLRTAGLAALTVASLAACGSSAPTKKDVIVRGNAICSGALRDVRALPPPAAGSLAGMATYLKQVVPIVQREAASIRALPRPAKDRALLERYVTALTATAGRYQGLEAAAARGDQAAVTSGLATLAADGAPALAAQYGLTQCAQAAGTGVS
jgi:hypothetical protein